MKILLLCEYATTNGINIRIKYYKQYLKLKGHELIVYGPKDSEITDKKILTISNPWYKDNTISIDPGINLLLDILNNNYDIIHICSPIGMYVHILYIARKIKNFKVIYSFHVNMDQYINYYTQNDILSQFYKYIFKNIIYLSQINISDIIFASSTHNDINKYFDIEPYILPTGIDTELFKYSLDDRPNNIIYVGRLAKEKNLFKLLDLFSLINNKYKLMIVGDGPIKEDLINYCKYKNIKKVKFIGNVQYNQLPLYYYKSKFLLSTSISETYGLTLLESLACGTPIVYAKCKVFDDLYYDAFPYSGYNINDIDDFIRAVKFVEDNEKAINEACYLFTKDKTWKNATNDLISIYKKLIK